MVNAESASSPSGEDGKGAVLVDHTNRPQGPAPPAAAAAEGRPDVTYEEGEHISTTDDEVPSPTRFHSSALRKRPSRSRDRPEEDDDDKFADDRGATSSIRRRRKLEGHGSSISYNSLVRPIGQTGAMRHWERLWLRFKHLAARSIESEAAIPSRQYRIPPREEGQERWYLFLRDLLEMSIGRFSLWCYRSSFVNVLFMFLVLYLTFISIFMLIIYGILVHYSKKDRVCVDDLNILDGFSTDGMELSFELSWTTFSTVGYGTVSPTTEAGCTFLRVSCAIEAFFGVLYASFCGAIIYSKVTRLHAQALVTFGSPMCLTYDTGVREAPLDTAKDPLPSKGSPTQSGSKERPNWTTREDGSLPYPVLEFRIVNDRANSKHADRDLIEASISCVVSVHEPLLSPAPPGPVEGISHEFLYNTDPRRASAGNVLTRRASAQDVLLVEKMPMIKRSFHPIKFEPERMPLFTRVWYARHTLDASSPLVRSEVREYIEKNGKWPESINDYVSIREEALIRFQKVLIMLNATSKVSADGVFAKKEYKYDDIYIGWQFAGVLFVPSYKEEDDGDDEYDCFQDVCIDLKLAHDILPQDGGGQEPLGGGQETTTHRVSAVNRPMSDDGYA